MGGNKMKNDCKLKVPTIFVDLDGTLVKHNYDPENIPDEFLPGARDTLLSWLEKGYAVVLVTARSFVHTRQWLFKLANEQISFTQVVCNLPAGKRILINDSKDGQDTAFSYVVKRDKGWQPPDDTPWKY
jgi:hypothetical protein